MKRIWRGIGVLAVAALVASSPVTAQSPEPGPTITIQTFQFKPAKLEAKVGTQITWTNQDDIRHTVTSGTPEKKDGRFDAPLAGKGTGFSFAFTEPGTYPYFCDRHQHMRGEIQAK